MLSTFAVDGGRRAVGPFVPTHTTDKDSPYGVHMVGVEEWRTLSSATLLMPRQALANFSGISYIEDECVAEYISATSGILRVVLPPLSYIDRAEDCVKEDGSFVSILRKHSHQCLRQVSEQLGKDVFEWSSEVGLCGMAGSMLGVEGFSTIEHEKFLNQRETKECI